jgi:hypothetical protein
LAIVFGAIGRKKANNGMARTGMAIGIICLGLIALAAIAVLMNTYTF